MPLMSRRDVLERVPRVGVQTARVPQVGHGFASQYGVECAGACDAVGDGLQLFGCEPVV